MEKQTEYTPQPYRIKACFISIRTIEIVGANTFDCTEQAKKMARKGEQIQSCHYKSDEITTTLYVPETAKRRHYTEGYKMLKGRSKR